jgi:transcriptional regulator with XRE-family HTH domain
MEFGDRLTTILKELRMSQKDLARRAGVDASMISKLKSGRKSPSLDLIDRLAHALDMAPLRLIDNTDLVGRYAAERVNPQDLADFSNAKMAARRERIAQPLIAIQQIYDAICDIYWTYSFGGDFDAFVESRYLYLTEQLRIWTGKAKSELEIDFDRGIYVPRFDDTSYSMDTEDRAIQYSRALILKELIPYDPLSAQAIEETSQRVGLTRIQSELAAYRQKQQRQTPPPVGLDVEVDLDAEIPW